MKPNKTFVIRHKESKELFQARSGKTSWKQPGHAKNAFNQSMFGDIFNEYGLDYIKEPSRWAGAKENIRGPRFDEQTVYEIVELHHESEDRLEQAVALLNKALGRCDYEIHNEIVEFLNAETN